MSNVEILIPDPNKPNGKLVLDGTDIAKHVRGFAFKHDIRAGSRLTLDVSLHETTSINAANVEVLLPPSIAALLERAGWTPPPGTASVLPRRGDGCPCEWLNSGIDAARPEQILGHIVPTCPVHGTGGCVCKHTNHDYNGTTARELNADADCPVHGEREDIHGWFGLSYASYFVANRSLLQSMPQEWQHRFTAVMAELDSAFEHIERPDYNVQAGRWMYLGDLTESDMKRLGIESGCDQPEDTENEHECWPTNGCTYHDQLGEEIDPHTACIFMPGKETIPHYARGRTHVKRADELAAEAVDRV